MPRFSPWWSALLTVASLLALAPVRAEAPSPPTTVRHQRIPSPFDLTPGYPGWTEVRSLLDARKRSEALAYLEGQSLTPSQPEGVALKALLEGVLRVETGDSEGAIPPLMVARGQLPHLQDIIDLHLAEALSDVDNPDQAHQLLKDIPEDSPYHDKAQRLLVSVALKRGASGSALLAIGPMVGDTPWTRLDPELLMLMGDALVAGGANTPEDLETAARIYQIITLYHPLSRLNRAADSHLKTLAEVHQIHPPQADFQDRLATANAYLRNHHNRSAINHHTALLKTLPPAHTLTCETALGLGRAYQKEREYSQSLKHLERVDTDACPQRLRVKALYLIGRAYARKGEDLNALSTYKALLARFPEHSMADDALLLAATLHQDNDQQEEATALLEQQLRTYPKGDMAAEASWRLAWADHREGRPQLAAERLKLALSAGSLQSINARLQARYWTARWDALSGEDAAARALGKSQLLQLAQEAPLHYYGLMAALRLERLDPDAIQALDRAESVRTTMPLPLTLPTDARWMLTHKRARDLYRAGLAGKGVELLNATLPEDPAGRFAHYLMMEALGGTHIAVKAGRVQVEEQKILAPEAGHLPWLYLAYPLPHGDLVQAKGKALKIDPLLFWGLMREESNFDSRILSWAGAHGLSQLMWPTAKGVAKKLNMPLKKSQLKDPAINIALGSTYLDGLLRQFDEHPGLAVPGYNAGPGAVKRWLKERGGWAFDEWVEAIPYKQTRDYTKRVLGAYQIYHTLYRPDAQPWIPLPMDLD